MPAVVGGLRAERGWRQHLETVRRMLANTTN
jgi:hypothetical protein